MTTLATLISVRNGLIGLSIQSTAPAVAAVAAQGALANRIVSGPALGMRKVWAKGASNDVISPALDVVETAAETVVEKVAEIVTAPMIAEVTETTRTSVSPKPAPKPAPEKAAAATVKLPKAAPTTKAKRPVKAAKPKVAKAKRPNKVATKPAKAATAPMPKEAPATNGTKPGKPATTVYQSPSTSGKSGAVTLAAMPEPKSRKDIN